MTQGMNKPNPIMHHRVHQFVEVAVGDGPHAKRVESLSNAVLGCLTRASLAIHAIGLGYAEASGRQGKHGVKQVDRFLSNEGIHVERIADAWVKFVVASRPNIVVTMDWTDFDDDDQTTICLNMVTGHGRATPLLWQTVKKSSLKGQRNAHEDAILQRLHDALPEGVRVTILADRGFGDTKLYAFLKELEFGFIIRFKENITVTAKDGASKTAAQWIGNSRRALKLLGATVTGDEFPVGAVVLVRAPDMKDAWCLVCSDAAMSASVAIAHYGKRFSTEENFRDTKDIRFGMGLSHTRISKPDRRDRLLLVSALAVAFLTLLGAAGESTGLDAKFRANTVKRRTHSLFRQGCMYYDCLPTMRDEWAGPLLEAFEKQLSTHFFAQEVLGTM